MDKQFAWIVHLFLTIRSGRRFPLGISVGTSANPFPSHTSEKPQRAYIREKQKAKEIVMFSEMLQYRLEAKKSGMLSLKSGSFQKHITLWKP